MIYRYEWEKGVWLIVALLIIGTFIHYAVQTIWMVHVHGTAIEDKNPTLLEQLRDRAAEWNIQREINQTLELADDFDWLKQNETK